MSDAYTLTIDMPDSQRNPDVAWRIQEFVRVLNASHVIDSAVRQSGDFVYVPFARYYADKPGQKFTRIVRDWNNQSSVECFVENATGKVVKAAGWKAPAKDKDGFAYRYDLMDPESRATLYTRGVRASYYKED